MTISVSIFSSSQSYRLTNAILVYQDASRNPAFASIHDVSNDNEDRPIIQAGVPASKSGLMAVAGNSICVGCLHGRQVRAGNPKIFLRRPKPHPAQARGSRDVDSVGGAGRMDHRPSADPITPTTHTYCLNLLFHMAVGEQSSKAVVS